MKIIFAAVVFFVCVVAHAATPSFGDFDVNQFQTNGSKVRIKSSVLLTNPIVNSGAISGNGAGLTNLAVLTTNNVFINNVTNQNLSVTNNAFFNTTITTNTATFNGKVTLNSNVYVGSLFFFTNALSTLTIDASKVTQAVSTNNNIVYTGYSNVDGTNAQPFTLIYTNSAGSAAVKFLQFPTGTIMLSTPYTNVVYLTNVGVLSGIIYPGLGTNATWVGN